MTSQINFTCQGVSKCKFDNISESWKNGRTRLFPRETWSVNFKWDWVIAVCVYAATSDFQIGGAKMFLMKFWLTLPNFMRELKAILKILISPSRDEGLLQYDPQAFIIDSIFRRK